MSGLLAETIDLIEWGIALLSPGASYIYMAVAISIAAGLVFMFVEGVRSAVDDEG